MGEHEYNFVLTNGKDKATMVKVPRDEYDDLVRVRALFDLIMAMHKTDRYDVLKVLDTIKNDLCGADDGNEDAE